MIVDKILKTYLEQDDKSTRRFIKSYSSPTIEMRAEACTMCLEVLHNVPEPVDSVERLKWRNAIIALREVYNEISRNDHDAKWKPVTMPSRSSQQMKRVKQPGFTNKELEEMKK